MFLRARNHGERFPKYSQISFRVIAILELHKFDVKPIA